MLMFTLAMTGVAASPALSPGMYSLEMKTKENGEKREKHDLSEFSLTINGTNVVLAAVKKTEPDIAGSVEGRRIFLAIQYKDPMLVGMKVRVVLEGEISKNDFASGDVKGFVHVNNYLNGTWSLQRAKDQ